MLIGETIGLDLYEGFIAGSLFLFFVYQQSIALHYNVAVSVTHGNLDSPLCATPCILLFNLLCFLSFLFFDQRLRNYMLKGEDDQHNNPRSQHIIMRMEYS